MLGEVEILILCNEMSRAMYIITEWDRGCCRLKCTGVVVGKWGHGVLSVKGDRGVHV